MYPIVCIALCYVLGVVAQRNLGLPPAVLVILLLLLFFATIFSFSNKKTFQGTFLLLIFSLGMTAYAVKVLPPPKTDVFYHAKEGYVVLIGVIDDEPKVKDKFAYFTLKVKALDGGKSSGKVRVSILLEREGFLRYGDEVKIQGRLSSFDIRKNPGLSSYGEYLEDQGIRARFYSRNSPIILSRGHGNIIKNICFWLRKRLISIPSKILPHPYCDLLGSIIFGSRASPPGAQIKEAFRRTGTIHLLVASGLHLSILVGSLMGLIRFFNIPTKIGIIIATAFGFIYAIMAGAGPSIIRAVVMTEMTLLALAFGREKDSLSSLSLAALLLLIVNPKSLFGIGFQLSFAATFALFYVAPMFEKFLSGKLPRFILIPISVSLAPVLMTMPIIIYYFSQVSVVAVVANALIISWVGCVVILGFVAVASGALFLPAANLISGALFLLLVALNWIVSILSKLPFACFYIKPPSLPLIFGYYAGLAGVVYMIKNRKSFKFDKSRFIIVALVIISIFIWHSATSVVGELQGKILEVTVLDVGQGDSILIETPGGKKVLIDGGEKYIGKNIVVPFLRRKGINKLDMVILTHPHSDHVGGLPEVLREIKVDSVLDSGIPHTSSYYREFLSLIEKNKIKYKIARFGDNLDFRDGVLATILAPSEPLLEGTNSDLNNNSIVMRLMYGKFSMLLTGDLEREGEERLIRNGIYLKSNILKAGHHGSNTSSSREFLEHVKPEVAIISVGARNDFGHPGKYTLERLSNINAKILRTDKDGAVVIKTNGEKFIIDKTKGLD